MRATLSLAERADLGGEDLSGDSIEWGRRDCAPPSIGLTERDFKLMALLHEVNFLCASQLLLLGWGESGGRVGRKRLKRLHDIGYVDRFRQTRAGGHAEWNYRLTCDGWSVLKQRGMLATQRTYSPATIKSIGYTEHDLQLAAVVIRIARQAAAASCGGLIDRMPFAWKGPRSGRIDILTSGALARSGGAQLPPGARLHPAHSRGGYLEPDTTLITQSDDHRCAVLIEYDRTERPHKQIDRLRRYDRWLLDGWRRGPFANDVRAPSVVFITSCAGPLRRLVQAADQTFSAWYGHQHAGPGEGTHPARKQVVFTSRERIRAGDWTMLSTPRVPPAVRDEPKVFAPRRVVLDLPLLLATGDSAALAA